MSAIKNPQKSYHCPTLSGKSERLQNLEEILRGRLPGSGRDKLLRGHRVLLWSDGNVLEPQVVAAQHCECPKCY